MREEGGREGRGGRNCPRIAHCIIGGIPENINNNVDIIMLFMVYTISIENASVQSI